MGTLQQARATKTSVVPTPLARVPTGNSGLDEVLCGGLPKNRTTLFSGGPGCGKSILALEFLVRGATEGKPGILVPFEERVDAVRANALTLGWDLTKLEQEGQLQVIDAHVEHEMITSGSFDLRGLLAIIEGAARDLGAERLALDAIDVLLRFFNDPACERERITGHGLELVDIFAGEGGVLTGVARREKEERDAIELRRITAQVEAKTNEIARRKAELDAETGRLSAAVRQAEIELKQLQIETRKNSEARTERSALRQAKSQAKPEGGARSGNADAN